MTEHLTTHFHKVELLHVSVDKLSQTWADMSEDKPAATVETSPAEVNAIPNGKGHEPGEDITASAKTPPAEDCEKWAPNILTIYFP